MYKKFILFVEKYGHNELLLYMVYMFGKIKKGDMIIWN